MPNQIFTNGASCKLGAAIVTTSAISSITLAVGFGSLFPSPTGGNWFVLTIIKADYSAIECFRCSARSGDVVTVETRAYDGTTANTFSTDDICVCSPNAGAFADFRADINALDTRLDIAETDIDALEVSVAALQTTMAQRPRMDVGTRTVFHQAAAPTGWTLDATVNDRVLRVSGTAGGGSGGSWTISGFEADGVALTVPQLPPHSHTFTDVGRVAFAFGSTSGPDFNSTTAGTTATTNDTGGGEEHGHPVSNDGSWRPAYTDVIVCTRASG